MAVRQPNVFGSTDNIRKEDLIAEVTTEYDRRMEERRSLELQWMLNIAYINGMQYLEINPVANRLEEVGKIYDWQERRVYNHIAPIIDTRMSMLQRFKPRIVARPGPNNSDANRSAAKIDTAILTTIAGDIQILSKLADMIAWLEYTGTAIIKDTWDMTKGPNVPQLYSSDGQMAKEGYLDCIVCSPQEILPDSIWHYDTNRCRNIIHGKVFHVDEIYDSWGAKVEPEDSTALKLVRSMSGIGGLGNLQLGFRITNAKLKDHAVVRELWEIPSKKYPGGRLVIVANKTLIYAGPMPYRIGDDDSPALPFTRIQQLRNPSCFFGRSVVERLIPLQQQYNALRNRKTEYLNRCAIGVMVAVDGSIDADEAEKQVGAPGALFLYREGATAPHYMENPALPTAFQTEEQTLLEEMRALGSVSELNMMSAAPPGVKSGIALSYLNEQDQNRISQTVSAISDGLIASAKKQLRLCKSYVKMPRALSMFGKQNILPIDYWNGTNIETENVILDISSLNIETPAARREMVFTMLQQGLFIDPKAGRITEEGRAKIFEMLDLGDWETFDDVDQRHIEKADRENVKLFQSTPINPANFDDHSLHIGRHNRQRISEEYEEAAAQDQRVALAFEYHINLHLQQLVRTALSQSSLNPAANTPQQGANNALSGGGQAALPGGGGG